MPRRPLGCKNPRASKFRFIPPKYSFGYDLNARLKSHSSTMYPAPVLQIARFDKGAGFLCKKSCKITYLKTSALGWCFLLIIESAGTTGTHLTWQMAVLPLKWSAPVSKSSDFKRGAGNSSWKSYNTEKWAGPVAAGWRHWNTGSAFLYQRNNEMGRGLQTPGWF